MQLYYSTEHSLHTCMYTNMYIYILDAVRSCVHMQCLLMQTWLSSNRTWMSSVPPRIKMSLDSLCDNTTNSVLFHASSTYTDVYMYIHMYITCLYIYNINAYTADRNPLQYYKKCCWQTTCTQSDPSVLTGHTVVWTSLITFLATIYSVYYKALSVQNYLQA